MEEVDVDVVTTNKELFQRNSNGVRLKQSKTGMFSEWYYLHGLPSLGPHTSGQRRGLTHPSIGIGYYPT